MADDGLDAIDEAPSFAPKTAIAAVHQPNWTDIRFLIILVGVTVFWLVVAAIPRLADAEPVSLRVVAKTLPDLGVYLGCAVLVALFGATVGAGYMALYWPARVERNRQRGDLSKYEASRIAANAATLVILPLAGLFLLGAWIYYRFLA